MVGRKKGRAPILVLAGALLALSPSPGTGSAAWAQDAGATPPSPLTEARTAAVEGFRSARFGMTEEEVREAIVADFGVSAEDIRSTRNEAERTTVLSVSVPDIIEDGGTAEVSYVLGYRSNTLIQVGCLWSSATDPEITPATLRGNAQALAAYFSSAGYAPDTVAMNLPIQSGLLVFRGTDAEGRMTILVLQGNTVATAEEPEAAEFTPVALTLYYTLDPAEPDIFRIEAGRF